MPHAIAALLTGLILLGLAYAAWSDLATRIVPNGPIVYAALLGLAARLALGPAALAASCAVSAATFLLLACLHARGWLGGGDVKLLAAISLGLAPAETLQLLTATALAGGVLAGLHLILRLLPMPAPCCAGTPLLVRVCTAERWRIRRHAPLPYAVAIAAAAAWVLSIKLGS